MFNDINERYNSKHLFIARNNLEINYLDFFKKISWNLLFIFIYM